MGSCPLTSFLPFASAGSATMRSSVFISRTLNSFGMTEVKWLKMGRLLGASRILIEIIQHAQLAPAALRFLLGEDGFADFTHVLRLVFVRVIAGTNERA